MRFSFAARYRRLELCRESPLLAAPAKVGHQHGTLQPGMADVLLVT
jgi:hypothetical protein